jgi:hypothetical protein
LSTFKQEIVVPEGHPSVKWVMGIRSESPSTQVNIVWFDPNGNEISGLRQKHSLFVEQNQADKFKVRSG